MFISIEKEINLEKISSQKLLQELVRRKVLIQTPDHLDREFVLRKLYQQKGNVYRSCYLVKSSVVDGLNKYKEKQSSIKTTVHAQKLTNTLVQYLKKHVNFLKR